MYITCSITKGDFSGADQPGWTTSWPVSSFPAGPVCRRHHIRRGHGQCQSPIGWNICIQTRGRLIGCFEPYSSAYITKLFVFMPTQPLPNMIHQCPGTPAEFHGETEFRTYKVNLDNQFHKNTEKSRNHCKLVSFFIKRQSSFFILTCFTPDIWSFTPYTRFFAPYQNSRDEGDALSRGILCLSR